MFASLRLACPGRLWVSRESYSLLLDRLALESFRYQGVLIRFLSFARGDCGYPGNLVRFLSSGLPWEDLGFKGFLFAFFNPACPARLRVSRESCSLPFVRLALGGFGYQGFLFAVVFFIFPPACPGRLWVKGILFAFFHPACPGRLWASRESYSLSLVQLALGGFGYQGVLTRFLWSGLPWEALGIKGILFASFRPACPGRLWVSRGSSSLSFVLLALGGSGYQGVLIRFLLSGLAPSRVVAMLRILIKTLLTPRPPSLAMNIPNTASLWCCRNTH